ncbi:MAG: hypothetical protein HYV51_00920 [Parcubacteria group bacterium]|nr:hypothetical protein [Parcubacteria group bacterium]
MSRIDLTLLFFCCINTSIKALLKHLRSKLRNGESNEGVAVTAYVGCLVIRFLAFDGFRAIQFTFASARREKDYF